MQEYLLSIESAFGRFFCVGRPSVALYTVWRQNGFWYTFALLAGIFFVARSLEDFGAGAL